MESLAQIAVGVAVALIVAVILFGLNVRSSLVRIETVLTGADGTNGLNSEVKALRRWRHNEIVPFQSKTDLRLARLEDKTGMDPLRATP